MENNNGIVIFAVFVVVVVGIILLAEFRVWPFKSDCDKVPSPCLNGATCEDEFGSGYKCTCTEDWSGSKCETPTTIGLSKRPCEKDKPCFHNAKCTDIKGDDGIYKDYTCECPEIEGHPHSLKWKGKNCNTFPNSIEDYEYETDCFKDVGKSEDEKVYGIMCDSTRKCFPKEKLKDNCPEVCESSPTHIWCPDESYSYQGSRCMDELNSEQI